MSRETLKSNALSCGSLAAGVDASAALAGLKLQRMSGDQIKKLLQEGIGIHQFEGKSKHKSIYLHALRTGLKCHVGKNGFVQ